MPVCSKVKQSSWWLITFLIDLLLLFPLICHQFAIQNACCRDYGRLIYACISPSIYIITSYFHQYKCHNKWLKWSFYVMTIPQSIMQCIDLLVPAKNTVPRENQVLFNVTCLTPDTTILQWLQNMGVLFTLSVQGTETLRHQSATCNYKFYTNLPALTVGCGRKWK